MSVFPPPQSRPTVTVAPAGGRTSAQFVCTGTSDDVVIAQAMTLIAGFGGGVVQLLEGTYSISAVLSGANNVVLKGLNRGATVLQAASYLNDNVINAQGVTNFVVRDLTINGSYATQFPIIATSTGASASTTIAMSSTTGIKVGLFAYGTGISGKPSVVSINPGVSVTVSTTQTVGAGVSLTFCSSDDNLGNGIRFDGCTNCGIEDVEVIGAFAHGVFWNNTHGSSDGCYATRVWVHGNGQIGFHVHADDTGTYYSHNYSIHQVWCYANSVVAVVPYVTGPRQYGGFYVTYHSDRWVTISNIMVWGERGPGVQIKGRPVGDAQAVAQGIVMTNVVVSGCGTDGITGGLNANVYIGNEVGSVTLNNLVSENANGDGVAFVSGALTLGPVFLNGGHIRGNGANGINLAAANSVVNGVRIHDVEISANSLQGIIYGGSALTDVEVTGCTLSGNNVSSTSKFAVNMAGAQRVKFVGNTFGLNTGGAIRLSSSSKDVLIEGNTFIDNCAASSGAQRDIDLAGASVINIAKNSHTVSARTNTANAIFMDSTTTAVTIDGDSFVGHTAVPIRFNGSVATAATRSLVTMCRLAGTAAHFIQCDASTAYVGTQSNIGGDVLDNSGGATVTQNFTGA